MKSNLNQSKTIVCLNPQCQYNSDRFINNSDQHNEFNQCKKWLHSIADLFTYDKQILNNLKRQETGLLFDFENNPIDAFKKLASIKLLNWKYAVSSVFNDIRQHFNASLELCQNSIIQSVQKYFINTKTYQSIQSILSNEKTQEQKSTSLTDLLNDVKVPHSSTLIFNPQSINNALSNISQIFVLFQDQFMMKINKNHKSSQKEKQKTKNIEQQTTQFQSWMREDNDNPYIKIQALASTFNVPPSQYLIEQQLTKVDCFLCHENMTAKNQSNKKNTKKTVTKLLLQHLIKSHWKQVFLNYRKKITKSTLKQYSMNQVIEEIQKQKIRRVQIIDRQNSGTYVADQNGQFVLEVVSEKNIGLATGNYVIAKSTAKDAADIVMSFIIKDLLNIKNLSVRLVTNDHFGAVIQQICEQEDYDFKVVSRIKK